MFMLFVYYISQIRKVTHCSPSPVSSRAAFWQARQVYPLTSYGAPHWIFLHSSMANQKRPTYRLQVTQCKWSCFLKRGVQSQQLKRSRVPRLEGSDWSLRTRVTIHNLHSISYRLWPRTRSRGSESKANSLHSTNTMWWPWALVTQKRKQMRAVEAATPTLPGGSRPISS